MLSIFLIAMVLIGLLSNTVFVYANAIEHWYIRFSKNIGGYKYQGYKIDNEATKQGAPVTINNVIGNHTVDYLYEKVTEAENSSTEGKNQETEAGNQNAEKQ